MNVSGGDQSTHTSQVAVFDINRTPISISISETIVIDEKDTILVAGEIRRGVFHGRAYRNITRDVWGCKSRRGLFLLGIPFIIFLGAGLFMMWDALQNVKAAKMVNDDAFRQPLSEPPLRG